MGLALVFFLVSLGAGLIFYAVAKSDKKSTRAALRETKIGFIIIAIILGIFPTTFIVGNSYDSYLENRAFYDATIEQYRGAVVMYKNYALIDMNKTRAAFTDFKYQGYQQEMANMIRSLQNKIVEYNHSFILKRVKNASWFFNWYIVANDPNMKIIRMLEKKLGKKDIHQVLIPDRPIEG